MRVFLNILILLLVLQIKAQVNAYAKVTSISGNVLSLSNVNQSFDTFIASEQVVVIQMQGASIGVNTNNSSNFGSLSSLNSAGLYEVVTIQAVNVSVSSMTITGALLNTYNTAGGLQIVSFPKLGTTAYTTTSNIVGVNWDGNIGGVIAFYVSGKLNLAHKITADGIGFRGGKISGEDGTACDAATYRSSTGNAKYGNKGEGIYITTSTQKAAKGRAVNGGGGGNLHNGGGGGGANFSSGGDGYDGWPGAGCGALNSAGGFGGMPITSSISRVFMGGGGGGGQENDNQASNGANGGGVILIKVDSIIISGACVPLTISANGDAATPSGQDGAGGGGAAGTIVLNIKGIRVKTGCPLIISADGGDGADVNHWDTHGSGGGGGQGAVYINASASFSNVTLSTNFGEGGHSSDDPLSPLAGSGGGPANAGVFSGSFSANPLPIKLLYFSAIEKESKMVELDWLTATEKNNSKFEVYHASNNSDWTKVIEVAGSGNSNTQKRYSALHLEPKVGLNYYRLKQIDKDGTFEYSSITYIEIEENKIPVKIYPNPSSGAFTLESQDDLRSENLTIVNALGEKVNFTLMTESQGKYRIILSEGVSGMFYIFSQNVHEKIIVK